MKKNNTLLFGKLMIYHILPCVVVPLASTFILFHLCQIVGLHDTTYWYLDMLKDTILFLISGYVVRSWAINIHTFTDKCLPSLLITMWFIYLALLYCTNSIHSNFGQPYLYTFFPLLFFVPLYTIGWHLHRQNHD